jgi:hypothetical protein
MASKRLAVANQREEVLLLSLLAEEAVNDEVIY